MRTKAESTIVTLALLMGAASIHDAKAQESRAMQGAVTIGSLDGEHDAFANLTDVLLLGNGLTLVLDRIEQRVVAFDAAGAFRWQYGRAGSGPGEFRWPAKLLSFTDSSFGVVDVARGRVIELNGSRAAVSFVGERLGPVGGMFMCSSAGQLAVARYSTSGSSIRLTDLESGARDSVYLLDLASSGSVADDVVASSPLGCGVRNSGWLQLNGSSGQLFHVDVARKRTLRSQLPDFSGFSVKPRGPGVVTISTPPDRHTAPWQILTLPSGLFVVPMQDRKTLGLNKARTAPVFQTLATYAYLVSVGDSLSIRRVATQGIVRAVGKGIAAVEIPGEVPQIIVVPVAWAR
jgi:hypothetical protein